MDSASLGGASALETRMRADLTQAMKERDRSRVAALRTALAAIANAEAPPAHDLPTPPLAPLVGRAQEQPRLVLTPADVEAIVRLEIADRRDTIEHLRGRDQDDAVRQLASEITVLERYLD
jgi:uncharacterized protein YqeY